MEGRAAGSEGHRRASDLVAGRFAALGLEPAGDAGTYFQTVRFEERRILPEATRARLWSRAAPRAACGCPTTCSSRVAGAPPPERVDAPLVFIGYGMHLPEAGHDDFAGLDLSGKVAVVIGGGPAACPARSIARPRRARPAARPARRGRPDHAQHAGAAEQPWADVAPRLGQARHVSGRSARCAPSRTPFLTASSTRPRRSGCSPAPGTASPSSPLWPTRRGPCPASR